MQPFAKLHRPDIYRTPLINLPFVVRWSRNSFFNYAQQLFNEVSVLGR